MCRRGSHQRAKLAASAQPWRQKAAPSGPAWGLLLCRPTASTACQRATRLQATTRSLQSRPPKILRGPDRTQSRCGDHQRRSGSWFLLVSRRRLPVVPRQRRYWRRYRRGRRARRRQPAAAVGHPCPAKGRDRRGETAQQAALWVGTIRWPRAELGLSLLCRMTPAMR